MRQANYKKKLHTHLKTVDESWQLQSPFFKIALKFLKKSNAIHGRFVLCDWLIYAWRRKTLTTRNLQEVSTELKKIIKKIWMPSHRHVNLLWKFSLIMYPNKETSVGPLKIALRFWQPVQIEIEACRLW